MLKINILFQSYFKIRSADYKTGYCSESQNETVKYAVLYFFAPAPIAFHVISIIIILFYPITAERARNNAQLIKEMQKYFLFILTALQIGY